MYFSFGLGVLVGFSFLVWFAISDQPVPKKEITMQKSFILDGKEWQCGYTPRQVEINLLEDKIKKLKQ